jgi:hypothetical protein
VSSPDTASVRINVQTGEVEIRGTEHFVEKLLPIAHALVGMRAPITGQGATNTGAATKSRTEQSGNGLSFADFLASKKLGRNAPAEHAMTAIVFYLTKVRGAESASTEQILEHFELAGIPKPTNPSSTLSNLRSRRGFLSSAGRGEVRLTIQGENFVAHGLGVE